MWRWCWWIFLLAAVRATVIPLLDQDNFDSLIASKAAVFVAFSAEWCRFSQILKPVFEEASNRFNDQPEVAFVTVDCDRQPAVAQKYHVNKYPTLKLFRNGELIKKEYRGQRSAEALSDYVKKQLEVHIEKIISNEDLEARLDHSKRNIIALFAQQPVGIDFENFQRAASALRDDCTFWLGSGDWVLPQLAHTAAAAANIIKTATVVFRPSSSAGGEQQEDEYNGSLADYEQLKKWLTERCIPTVREITFENAEELTEEGVPFLILFRRVGDTEAEAEFTRAVLSELKDLKDGKRFAHPLHHLGKAEKDLPLIAIDSFRHMYLFPSFSQLSEPGRLRQFVVDLNSGKLHREFHHGPDPSQQPAHEFGQTGDTAPPSSVFKQLKPSDNRYSILNKDEL